MSPIWRIGLTGGIGSGKSTVAACWARTGAAVIDADAISRNTTEAGGSAIEPIRQIFGPEFITPDGALDRQRMRDRVFKEPEARQQLEAIIHPLVRSETERQAESALARGARVLVFDVPLLVESIGWRQRVDRIMVVDCLESTQITRTMQRSGLSRQEVERIMAQQSTRAQRLQAADCVLYNDGISLEQLDVEVAEVGRRFGL